MGTVPEWFIGIMAITGFIVWVLVFAYAVGVIAEHFGIRKYR